VKDWLLARLVYGLVVEPGMRCNHCDGQTPPYQSWADISSKRRAQLGNYYGGAIDGITFHRHERVVGLLKGE
jgi:hypothetical protein